MGRMSASLASPRTDSHGPWRNWGFVASGIVLLLAFAAMVRLHWQFGTLRGAQVPETIGWYLLAFAGYLGALLWAERRGVPMQ